MSKLGEFILSNCSRNPNAVDYVNEAYEQKHRDVAHYVSTLERTFPDIARIVAGRKVLDIGCAEGMETLALSTLGAKEAHGIDVRIDNNSNEAIRRRHPDRNMSFSVMDAHNTAFPDGSFDVIVTCGSFEHFADPRRILIECKRLLRPNGRILLTSGVWAHPWGAHMNFFTRVPWVQFLFSERTIMNVRRAYRDDGAQQFHEVEGGLNKIGVGSFKRLLTDVELTADPLRLNPVKGLAPLTRVPVLSELFTNLIIAVIRK